MKILNGKELAGFIKERQAHQVKLLNKQPKLLIVHDNNSPVIEKYIELKKHYGEDIGIPVEDFYTKTLEGNQKLTGSAYELFNLLSKKRKNSNLFDTIRRYPFNGRSKYLIDKRELQILKSALANNSGSNWFRCAL